MNLDHAPRWVNVSAVVVVVGMALLCFFESAVLVPMVCQMQRDRLDTSFGSVGSPADGSVPVVSTLKEVEQNERFAVQVKETKEEFEDVKHNSGGMLGDVYYSRLQLEDGTIVAARVNHEASSQDIVYVEDGSMLPDIDYVLHTYPIGVLKPWPKEAAEAASSAGWFTYKEGYLDMQGDFGVELPDEDKLRKTVTTWTAGIGVLVFLISVGIAAHVIRKREEKASLPENDLERWILGTYANWAQFFFQVDYKGRLKSLEPPKKSPLYFGGRLKDGDSKRLTKRTLKTDWDIQSLQDLLETVDYMSVGPGFQNCVDKTGKAWELCRSMQLLGMGYVAGWLTREEMIQHSCGVGKLVQASFHSWEDLTASYLEGHDQWRRTVGNSEGDNLIIQMRHTIHENLCARPDSPYLLPWNLILDPRSWAGREE